MATTITAPKTSAIRPRHEDVEQQQQGSGWSSPTYPGSIASLPPKYFDLPPDGGKTAWLQVVGSFFLFFNSWGLMNAFGTIQSIYEATFLSSYSASSIAWIGSLQFFLMFTGSLVTGSIFDRGHMHVLIFTGTFFIVFGLMMLSLCHTFWQVMLAQGLCVGIGSGLLFVPACSVVSQYFTTRRALAMSLAVGGVNIGGVVFSAILNELEPSIGLRWAYRIIGFIALATLIPSGLIMKQRNTADRIRPIIDTSAFKETRFMIFAASVFISMIGFYIPWFFVNSYGRTTHIVSEHLASYLVAILNAGSVVGRIILCWIADRVGAINVFLACSIATVALNFGWIGLTNTGGTVVLFTLYGAFCGTYVSLMFTVLAGMCPEMSKLGVRSGMVFSLCAFSFLIGNPAGGKLLEYGWIATQSFGGACIALGCLLTIALKCMSTASLPVHMPDLIIDF